MNDIVIYSQKLAGILMMNGYRLVGIDRNNKDTRKFIFIFKYNEEILKLIEAYKHQD